MVSQRIIAKWVGKGWCQSCRVLWEVTQNIMQGSDVIQFTLKNHSMENVWKMECWGGSSNRAGKITR